MAEKKFDLRKLQEADVPKHYISAEEKETAKFGKLVFEFPQERNEIVAEGDPVDYIVKPQAYFRGASQIPGSEFNQSYQIFVKPFFLDRVQHRHIKDEYLASLKRCFERNEFVNIRFSDNDVKKMGAGGESYGIQIQQDYYSSTYGDKGTQEMYYNGPVPCKYDANKKCDTCGKCLQETWEK